MFVPVLKWSTILLLHLTWFLSCLSGKRIWKWEIRTSFPMISAFTILAPISFKSASVIFFAGMTTSFLFFSSSSASELELLSVPESSLPSSVFCSLFVLSASRAEELSTVPVSTFFLHPPDGLETDLSSLLRGTSFGSKSHVDDVTVDVDEAGRLNLPANEELQTQWKMTVSD